MKVREGLREGSYCNHLKLIELPHSVKVREGLREGPMRAMFLLQSVKVREGSVKSDVKGF